MIRRWARESSALVVVAAGAALLLASLGHHLTEIRLLGRIGGPLLAVVLEAVLALAIAYGGYRLAKSDVAPQDERVVAVWCLVGAAVFVGAVAAGVLIRQFEGRTVTEPTFELLLAAGVGGVAGLVGGYYHARSRRHARRAERTRTALTIVNDVLRHDVRNDMGAVFAHAEFAADACEDESVAESVEVIREQAERTTSLIESASAIVEALSEDPEFSRTDVAAIAAEAADRTDDAYSATVETDLPERAPATANEGVRSAVRNLVENAAEHNDAEDPRVEVTAAVEGETVRLRVADNGPGLTDREKAEAFEPSEGSGHGGGLYLVETLVENYGGSVRVEDNDAGGATFVLELPRHDAN